MARKSPVPQPTTKKVSPPSPKSVPLTSPANRMTHEERLQIAREVADRILEKYGDQVTAIAVYGSVSKGEDAAYSDIDMWVATSTSRSIEDVRFFVYKGIPIS